MKLLNVYLIYILCVMKPANRACQYLQVEVDDGGYQRMMLAAMVGGGQGVTAWPTSTSAVSRTMATTTATGMAASTPISITRCPTQLRAQLTMWRVWLGG